MGHYSEQHEADICSHKAAQAYARQVGGSHYKSSIDPDKYIAANNLNFREGNIIKYVTRWRKKGGVEDLRKARDYLNRLIAQES